MAKRSKRPPPVPPEAEPFIRHMMGLVLSSPLASLLAEGDAIENLAKLRESHALALFRRIQNQSAVFTEGDREELMNLASNAANGGFLIDAMQNGIRLGENNREKGKTARDGNTKNAATWRALAEERADDLWRKKPHFRENFSKTAAEIRPGLKATLEAALEATLKANPKATRTKVPGVRSIADHLSAWAKQKDSQF
jgi:hypothetical protein